MENANHFGIRRQRKCYDSFKSLSFCWKPVSGWGLENACAMVERVIAWCPCSPRLPAWDTGLPNKPCAWPTPWEIELLVSDPRKNGRNASVKKNSWPTAFETVVSALVWFVIMGAWLLEPTHAENSWRNCSFSARKELCSLERRAISASNFLRRSFRRLRHLALLSRFSSRRCCSGLLAILASETVLMPSHPASRVDAPSSCCRLTASSLVKFETDVASSPESSDLSMMICVSLAEIVLLIFGKAKVSRISGVASVRVQMVFSRWLLCGNCSVRRRILGIKWRDCTLKKTTPQRNSMLYIGCNHAWYLVIHHGSAKVSMFVCRLWQAHEIFAHVTHVNLLVETIMSPLRYRTDFWMFYESVATKHGDDCGNGTRPFLWPCDWNTCLRLKSDCY